jgi:hypothetical protein
MVAGLVLTALGCSNKGLDGPAVDAFTGRLTRGGKPVRFAEGEDVLLQLFYEKGQSYGVPIRPDGWFRIGPMPVGKYSAALMRQSKREKGPPMDRYNVPGGLTIREGQTEYAIDLGEGWKP